MRISQPFLGDSSKEDGELPAHRQKGKLFDSAPLRFDDRGRAFRGIF